jgi:homoserine dehydrogenase
MLPRMRTRGVGVIGYGVVGRGVVDILRDRRGALERAGGPYELIGVAVRQPGAAREGLDPSLVREVDRLLADPALDILVEVAGGVEAPFEWVRRALQAGKTVVTANKALLAERAVELHALVEQHGGRLFCEAAVAGGIPIIGVLDRGLVANRILLVEGILNGTCNYILTKMERERLSFDQALRLAQGEGFAEADPTLDVGGGDAAHKLAVLAGLVLGWPITAAQVYRQGIEALTAFDLQWAEQNGFRIKLLAIGRFHPDAVELRVHPTLVPKTRLISQVMDEFNAVAVEGDLAGSQLYQGRGAGRLPTASAVVADIVGALRDEPPLRARPRLDHPPRLVPMGEVISRHYLHLEVIDQPGVVAKVATALAQRGISITSMYQPEIDHGSQVPLVFTTHPAKDAQVTGALEALASEPFLVGHPVHVRMES